MRSTNRIAAGECADFIVRNVDSEGLQTFDDLWIPAVTPVTQSLQASKQVRVLLIKKVPQNVQLRVAGKRADFHPRYDLDSTLLSGRHGLSDTRHDVVIGDRQGRHPCLVCHIHHLSGRATSVRVGGMQMKVQATHVDGSGVKGFCATSWAV